MLQAIANSITDTRMIGIEIDLNVTRMIINIAAIDI